MNTAGGPVQGDEAWPIPPLALPRGPREHIWHGAVLASLLSLAVIPELRVPTVLLVLGLGAMQALTGAVETPWLLRRVALGGFGLAGAAGWWRLEASRVRGLVGDMALRRADLSTLDTTDRIVIELGLWSAALLTVATVIGFDLRVVNRQVADERVWARQQVRRRQVMARHHRRNPPPEAL